MEKSTEAFRSIGEVARLVGVATHVLRYWETQFPQLSPVKRADGRRYYRPDDVRLAAGLCEVLREDGLTIRGARKLIAADKGAALRARGTARLGPRWTNGGDGGSGVPADARQHSALPRPPARPAPAPPPDRPGVEAAPRPAVRDAVDAWSMDMPWLQRLVLTTQRLRGHDAPLPDDARQLAEGLRALCDQGG